jgi:hypothetical protein
MQVKNLFQSMLLWHGLLFSAFSASASFRFFNTTDSVFPAKVSQLGLYRDLSTRVVADGIHPFEVNTPLWSDGAIKKRYVILPVDSQIIYSDTAAYLFPSGTVFVKNFMMDTVQDDPKSRIYLETRILFKNGTHSEESPEWTPLTYAWNTDQLDAQLVPEEGSTISYNVHLTSGSTTVLKKNGTIPVGRNVFGAIFQNQDKYSDFFPLN